MTGDQLAMYAMQAYEESWGYIYGTSGQVWTQAAQDRITRDKVNDPNYDLSIRYGSKWIGSRVADCSGLVMWACAQIGIKVPHGSNAQAKNGYLKKLNLLVESDIPVGSLVFKLRGNSDYHHVGIYVGGGDVIEARGSKTGVVKSKLSTWTHWGVLKALDQGKEEVVPMSGKAIVDVPNDGTLNIRSKPSTKGQKLTTVREGSEVEVLAISGDWAKVRYTGEGYVMTKFLKVVSEG